MPIVDMKQMLQHAHQHGYAVGGFDVVSLDFVEGVIRAAERCEAPIILSLAESHFDHYDFELLMAAVEAAATRTPVPVAIHLDHGESEAMAVKAINLGCNGVMVDASKYPLEENIAHTRAITLMAHGCGVAVEGELGYVPGVEGEDAETERMIRLWGGVGRAAALLKHCRHWSLVEHTILYNTANIPEEGVDEMMVQGQRVLSAIPGVRRVFCGEAVQDKAAYRYSWHIQFCHPAVIDGYREHPDHVAFANSLFRPVAADRISIDYRARPS